MATEKTPKDKKFKDVSVTLEHYRSVLALTTPQSIAAMKKATQKRLLQIRTRVLELLKEITAGADATTVTIPVLQVQYVKATKQSGARYLYRKALTDTLELCNTQLKEMEGLSPLIADVMATPEAAPAPVVAEEPAEPDDLPLEQAPGDAESFMEELEAELAVS